jgi:hypothetical protein
VRPCGTVRPTAVNMTTLGTKPPAQALQKRPNPKARRKLARQRDAYKEARSAYQAAHNTEALDRKLIYGERKKSWT